MSLYKFFQYLQLLFKKLNEKYIQTKHKVDDTDQYEMLENNNIINQAPAKRTADKFVLKCAKNWNCKFLTNDQFMEYWDEFGEEWVIKNRVTCMFVEGELILD